MRLVEWSSLSLLIRAERIAPLAAVEAKKKGVENLVLSFRDGSIQVSGALRKLIPLPFSIVLSDPMVYQKTISIRIAGASAFFFPLPKLLLWIAEGFVQEEGISIDASAARVSISLVRFLPTFADIEIAGARFVPEGVLIELGPGGVDPPGVGGF